MKVWLVLILLIPGCFEAQEQIAQVDPYEYGRIAGIAGLVCSFDDDSSPSPSPAPQPGDMCPTCNGTGRVGDGTVSSKCLDCDGTGKVLAEEIPEQPSSDKEENASSGQGSPGAQTYSAAYTAALRDGKPLVVLISAPRKPIGGDFDGGGMIQSQMAAVLAGIDLSGVHFVEVIASSPDGLRLWSGHYVPQLLVYSRSPEGTWRKTKTGYAPASQIMEAISNAKQYSLQRKTTQSSRGSSSITVVRHVRTTRPVYQIQTRRRIFRRR